MRLAEQESVDRVQEVAADLHHPLTMRFVHDASDFHRARLQVDYEVSGPGDFHPGLSQNRT